MDEHTPEVVAGLMGWYHANARPLPWRASKDPYRILLSELMCQQTRVDTAIPFFERFVRVWPTLEDFARATEEEVVAALLPCRNTLCGVLLAAGVRTDRGVAGGG